MKRILLTVCLLGFALHAADKFTFARPVRPGSHWECRIRTAQSDRYTFQLAGGGEPVIRLQSVQAEFSGYLTVRQVNAAGHPVQLMIRVNRFSGSLDGRAVKHELVSGTELEADLADGKAVFSRNGQPMGPELQAVLGAMFPPASETGLADLTGAERILTKPGQGWPCNLKPYLDMLAGRGVRLPAAAFKSGVAYLGSEPAGRVKCRKFKLLIETANLTDYDCRFQLTFWLAPEGPPVCLVREIKEVIRQVIRAGQPLSAGTRIELIREDHTEQELLPLSRLPAPPVRRQPKGAWDSLLR